MSLATPVLPALRIGRLTIESPVVLAPRTSEAAAGSSRATSSPVHDWPATRADHAVIRPAESSAARIRAAAIGR